MKAIISTLSLLVILGAGYLFFQINSSVPANLINTLDKPLELPKALNSLGTVPFETTTPPNIVIIMADDLGWNDVGYHGSDIHTPNLDMLAKNGVELNRFYAHPTCSPTRSSLMTGKSPVRLGVLAPLSKLNPKGLPIEEVTLAERLREQGYQTALVGKWHLGGRNAAYTPNSRGFDYFYGNLMGGSATGIMCMVVVMICNEMGRSCVKKATLPTSPQKMR